MKVKKVLYVLAIILIIMGNYGCNDNDGSKLEDSHSRKDVVITGKIENFKISDSINYINIFKKELLKISKEPLAFPINSLGEFSLNFEVSFQQDISLLYKKGFLVIVNPGDSIHVTFDGQITHKKELYKSIKFSGTSTTINQNLAKYLSNSPLDKRDYAKNKKLLPQEFKRYHDSIYKNQHKYLINFVKQNKVSKELKSWLEVEQKIVPLTELIRSFFDYDIKNRNNPNRIIIKESYFGGLYDLPLLEERHLINSSLNNF